MVFLGIPRGDATHAHLRDNQTTGVGTRPPLSSRRVDFFGLTIYLIVEDYKQYAEPGSFSARINLAIGRVENFIEPLIEFELPRL